MDGAARSGERIPYVWHRKNFPEFGVEPVHDRPGTPFVVAMSVEASPGYRLAASRNSCGACGPHCERRPWLLGCRR